MERDELRKLHLAYQVQGIKREKNYSCEFTIIMMNTYVLNSSTYSNNNYGTHVRIFFTINIQK